MEHVLEILLQVENLTANERAKVQNGLTFIQSDIPGTTTSTTTDLETLSDLSGLISIRYKHQSEEEASAVRVARAHTVLSQPIAGNSPPSQSGAEQDGVQLEGQPNSATAAQDPERRQLARKINSIIKASTEVPAGQSTGLNRRARWTTDKVAAGSTLPAGGIVTATGNSANAQATARKAAKDVGVSLLQ
jgi:hypothetical protein